MRRARRLTLATAAALVAAGCAAGTTANAPTWEPSPDFGVNGEGPGVHVSPLVPLPSLPADGSGGSGAASAPKPGSPPAPRTSDPNVLATNLNAPVGLTLLPDGAALVGERTTGRIVQVQPTAGQPVPTVKTITGLDTAGGGGLLDLAVSPTYSQDNLIYAYLSTRTDNRVVEFTLHGPVTPVLTGIPRGSSDNTGRLSFGTDGNLYVGTGDAGTPALAAATTSLAGKVLRVTDIGDPAPGNPHGSSPVWTSGHRDVDGLCSVPGSTTMLTAETGAPGQRDEVNVLAGGDFYGWPTIRGGTAHRPAATLPAGFGAPGGCAVLQNQMWVTSLNGQALLAAPLAHQGTSVTVGKFSASLVRQYGRLRTVVAAADGALWLTTSNRDGHGRPVAADERVIRIVPSGGGGSGASV